MKYCDCTQDGHCPRYQRDMSGRLREICAGVNVDLGTAAAFRAQWAMEAGGQCVKLPPGTVTGKSGPQPLLLKADQAVGDMVAMTAAIYSLHRAHPGKYLTSVESKFPEVFEHNPDVVPLTRRDAAEVQMHYPAIHRSNERAIHFMQGWCEHLSDALGVPVPLLTNRPRLYFALDDCPPVQDFWVVCSGGKDDFTNKQWGGYQEVVDRLRGEVSFVQVGAEGHHPHLLHAVDLVGETTLRQLFSLVRIARGVLCGVSLLMHVAAALERPAVVIAGGREPVAWNAYPRQQYVHTIGALPCSTARGEVGGACWRSRVVGLNDGTLLDRDTCERPVGRQPALPECMTLISPAHVADLILCYNCH